MGSESVVALTSSPMLVFTMSSFSLSAALANRDGQVRSPAVCNYYFMEPSDPAGPRTFWWLLTRLEHVHLRARPAERPCTVLARLYR